MGTDYQFAEATTLKSKIRHQICFKWEMDERDESNVYEFGQKPRVALGVSLKRIIESRITAAN